ncbi:MAG: hypothetical protein RH859_13040 [Longimicrobiales bacterium]
MADPEQRAKFTDQIEEQVEALRRKFQEMELSQMRKGELEARALLADAKKAVSRQRTEAARRVASARKASAAGWNDVKEGLQTALDDLSEAVERAHRRFEGIEEDEESEETAGV